MLSYTKEGVSLNLFHENRYATKNNLKAIKLVVYFRRQRKYFPTGISLSDEDFTQLFTSKKKDLVEKRHSLESSFYKFKGIVDHLLEKSKFSFENIESQLGVSKSLLLKDRYDKKIATLKSYNQFGTALGYKNSISAISKFDSRKLDLKHITVDWLKKFERHELDRNLSYTTIGIYVRHIRTIMNEAITQGVLDKSFYPFGRGKYEIPTGEGRKLALPLYVIKQIYYYESSNPIAQRHKDLWMFSYLCNGANFNDLLRLKFKNINGNEISFLRGKTRHTSKKKKEVVVFLTDEMRKIIEKIGNPVQLPDNYIFPFLTGNESIEREMERISSIIQQTNKYMKRIGEELEVPFKITTYTARHSYATVLKRSGANIAFISESLGHSDLKTTENYLASFETEEREKNAKLLMAF